ncbi:E3 ubiquitin-protein ligase MBR2 isoform X1 [Lathyrus oleraceus]|uniref:E3 ubiquitin-protein ligase MBR2 isoform X1 n=1 Tax=Pisum sativum TaxID=3888 RepID=UPI0021D17709|nr:E3 ubiquitin-protein ligase MBR2-like isoform X1 [Pisum sativum]
MPVLTRRMKWRRPISETDPSSQISPIIQSISCKSTITTLFSTFSNNETTHDSNKNRTNSSNKNRNSNSVNNTNTKFSAASTLRGLGCTAGASQQVSVPAVIRSSVDWQKNRKKKNRRNSNINIKSNKTCHGVVVVDDVPFQDVWCGPGIGFSSDAVSEDCVVTRKNVSSRGKLDNGERISSHREQRSSYFGRHNLNQSSLSFLDDDDDDDNSDVFTTRHGLESFGNGRFYRNSEIMIIQGKRLMGGRVNSRDQFRDWRLDVDNMSYEQLLELGERIGYVKTGLKEDEMRHNIKKIKVLVSNDMSKHQIDKKCTICQEEYELDDELGMLNCEHCYHFQCIKQWLVLKNFCPVCKQEVAVRR